MLSKVSWYLEGKIILVEMSETVTIEEVALMNTEVVKLLELGDTPIHTIFDTTKPKQFPLKIMDIAKAVTFLSHPNIGYNITINTNPVINFLAQAINGLQNRPTEIVPTLEAAIKRLHSLDRSLAET